MNTQSYLKHHYKQVRIKDNTYRILAHNLKGKMLVGADCIAGANVGEYIDLIRARTPLSTNIRQRILLNLIS